MTKPTNQIEMAVTGRITAAAIADLAEHLAPVLDAADPFTVLFDRRAMTAFTDEGRAALEEFWTGFGPVADQRCAAWADLYDERRAASLQSNSSHVTQSAYPHAVFADAAAARSWLTMLLTERVSERAGVLA